VWNAAACASVSVRLGARKMSPIFRSSNFRLGTTKKLSGSKLVRVCIAYLGCAGDAETGEANVTGLRFYGFIGRDAAVRRSILFFAADGLGPPVMQKLSSLVLLR